VIDDMELHRLRPDQAGDMDLAADVANLVNGVYAVAEKRLWIETATRTTTDDIATLIGAGEITVARDGPGIIGCIRVHHLDADTSEFGMLAAAFTRRSLGVGRSLVSFAERQCLESGRGTMQLELLVPRGWSHPSKEFLADWYGRLGYIVLRRGTLDEPYPQLAPLLATPCDLLVYRKDLTATEPGAVR
jgi:GNAT superfamily N-acetyltransferase